MAHDPHNTLVPIVALSQAMARRLPEGSRERTSLDLIVQAADRARDLVRRILTFSRKEAAERKLVNLGEVVGQSIKLLRSLVPTTIDLVSELAPVPPVIGDPGQCYQILVNLVSNASRAIGSGPGTITVRLACDSATNEVMLAVEDTGCGMDEATQRRIFEPFYTTRKVGEGTGLGLSVVHGIVASHGGRIDVQSARPGPPQSAAAGARDSRAEAPAARSPAVSEPRQNPIETAFSPRTRSRLARSNGRSRASVAAHQRS